MQSMWVNDELPKDRDVAMVFQNYGLYPHMSVYENIRYPLKVRRVPKSEHAEQVRRAAEKVRLEQLLDRRRRELSGGQRQRVALARAIVRTPTVFLMDEPLSNLDAKLRVSMRAELKHLQHELRITTVYVTHDQIEAMTLADRVAVMDHGIISQLDTPENIYNDPTNLFCRGLHWLSGHEPDSGNASAGPVPAPASFHLNGAGRLPAGHLGSVPGGFGTHPVGEWHLLRIGLFV